MRFFLLILIGISINVAAETPVTVLTYNVLAEPLRKSDRIKAINAIIETHKPDIVCLQEVAPWVLFELQQIGFLQRYRVAVQRNHFVVPRGLLIAVRKEFGELADVQFGPIGGRQGRHYLIQQITHQSIGQLTVATTHLESFLDDAELRKQQLSLVFDQLAPYKQVVFAADFNFGDDTNIEPQAIPKDYQDAWRLVHPKNPGFTWNIEQSPMAKRGSFQNETSRRIDHIYTRGHTQVKKATLVGNTPIADDDTLFPSDHFGVIAQILMPQIKQAP